MHAPRLAPLAAVASLAAVLVAPGGASAAPSAPSMPATRATTEHVLLTLTPHDRGLLRAIAADHAHGRVARAASLADALPTATDRSAVIAAARSLGLTVDSATRLAVSVTGPADVVNRLFGSARSVAPWSRVGHPLPRIPIAFGARVTAAFGGDETRPAFRHFETVQGTADGGDLRTAYGDTNLDPTVNPGATHTIATVQLSGWHSSDLTRFANDLRAANAAWPTPSYVPIDDPADPAAIATKPTLSNGKPNPEWGNDMEVDLDQEAIYAVDPYARQRAYTSGNDPAGMFDSLVAIGDDASNPTTDRHIVAASISWGQCESDLTSGLTQKQVNDLYNAFEDALSYLLSTGVTVFAATGDTGASCISYPATSPQVIAVGGTQATTPSDRTTQTGWTESATSASGGGASTHFAQPAYQAGVDPTYHGGRRTIPDISALAGQPGFEVYTTSPAFGAGYTIAGGTSLASPIATTTFVAELLRHGPGGTGYGWGIGDIHAGLYAQRNDPGAFFDVTSSGSNGSDVARAGYDRVTGIGTPVWSTLLASSRIGGQPHFMATPGDTNRMTVSVAERQTDWQSYTGFRIDSDLGPGSVCATSGYSPTMPTTFTFPTGTTDGLHDLTLTALATDGCHRADAFVFLDRAKPKPAATLRVVGGATRNVVASWSATDANGDNGSGVRSRVVTLTGAGHTYHPTRSPFTVSGVSAKPFSLTITAIDWAGNTATTVAHLLDDRNFAFARFWSRQRTRSAYGASQATTLHAGAHLRLSATAKTYVLYVATCASCGRIGIYTRAGHLLKVVNTYSGRTRFRVPFVVLRTTRYAARTLLVRALGTHDARSHGNRVTVDALTTTG